MGVSYHKISLTLGFPLPEKNFDSIAWELVKRVLYSATVFPYHPIFLNAVYLRWVCRFHYLSIISYVLGPHKNILVFWMRKHTWINFKADLSLLSTWRRVGATECINAFWNPFTVVSQSAAKFIFCQNNFDENLFVMCRCSCYDIHVGKINFIG